MSKRSILIVLGVVLALTAGLIGTTAIVSAEAPEPATGSPFLCPIVGDGVINAPGKAGKVLQPDAGTSFIPGHTSGIAR
jgi:hypothetical protein